MGWTWKLRSKPLWIPPERGNPSLSPELKGSVLVTRKKSCCWGVFREIIGRHGCIPELSCEFRRMLDSINVQFWGRNAKDSESFWSPQWSGGELYCSRTTWLIGIVRKRRISATRIFLINSPLSFIQSGGWILGMQTTCGKLIFAVETITWVEK